MTFELTYGCTCHTGRGCPFHASTATPTRHRNPLTAGLEAAAQWHDGQAASSHPGGLLIEYHTASAASIRKLAEQAQAKEMTG